VAQGTSHPDTVNPITTKPKIDEMFFLINNTKKNLNGCVTTDHYYCERVINHNITINKRWYSAHWIDLLEI